MRGCDDIQPCGATQFAWIYDNVARVPGNQELGNIDCVFCYMMR